VRLSARNLRGYIAGLAGPLPPSQSTDETLVATQLVEHRLPTPLSLATTSEGLALTAIAPPIDIEPAVADAPPAPQFAPVDAPIVAFAPAVVDPPAPPEAPEVDVPGPVREPKPRRKRREILVERQRPVARAGEPQIEFRDVSVTFGAVSALRGITFTIKSGELVFLVGASGAGKTTTFRLMSGQLRPGKGQVWVDRVPVHKARRHRVDVLRRRIGFVGEDYALLANRTALENIEFALRMSDLSLPGSEVKRRALAELRHVALLARATALPGELSTGQRQRLALARALVTRPVVLLADEPTAGLDTRNAMRVMHLLQRAASRQTAVVVATHDGPMAASVTARILSLDKGRLAGDFPSWVELCRPE
jgi:cell division transport system ATP-binding protein